MHRIGLDRGMVVRLGMLGAVLALLIPANASAAITPSRDAGAVAGAITDAAPAGSVTGTSFPIIPPTPQCSNGEDDDFDGLTDFPDDPECASASDDDEDIAGQQNVDTTGINPAAVSDTALAGFPTSGSTYAILSSGDATIADDPNNSGSSGESNNGGDGGHGGSFFDVVTLQIDLDVPASANCLQVDFRFLSEEFPEFVGGDVNDAFVAELDSSTFTADPAENNKVIAPNNFAFDQDGNVVSINTAGFSAANATGTTYDGATELLRASTPLTPGAHSIFLSVFDQGDSIYDSAAFIDQLVLRNLPAASCQAGAEPPDTDPPDTTITSGPAEGSTSSDPTPTFEFTSDEPGSTFECSIDGSPFAPCSSGDTFGPLADGNHTFQVRAIDPSGNVDPTPAERNFAVDTGAPDATCQGEPATIVGTDGNDVIIGTPGRDVIAAGDGNDKIRGGAGDDTISGGGGGDKIRGGAGDDTISGGGGGDKIRGGAGTDSLFGGPGNDSLFGGPGTDFCDGGPGTNSLKGCE